MTARGWMSIAGAIALGVACFLAYQAISYHPRKQTAYASVSLGMKMDEVEYILGAPETVGGQGANANELYPLVKTADFKDGDKITNFFWWDYNSQKEKGLVIKFHPKFRRVTDIRCFSQGAMLCPELIGISDGATEEDVIAKLGLPSGTSIDNAIKTIEYRKLGASFSLKKKKVYMLSVFAVN